MNDMAEFVDPSSGPLATGSSSTNWSNKTVDLGTPHFSSKGSQDRSQVHPVWVIHAGERLISLRIPVALRVQFDGARYYAENVTLDVCGYGESRYEAIRDAISDIEYYHDYYTSLPDAALIGVGLDLKRRFLGLG